MGKAAELREKLELEVQEFMAGVTDDNIIVVGRGTFYGNTLLLYGTGGAAWKSGPNSSESQACDRKSTFVAARGNPSVQEATCPRGVRTFKIDVK